MHWVYRLLRVIVRVTLRVIFPVVDIENRERLRAKGPFIYTGNHPNTVSDVFLAVAWLREQVFFLANAGLFQNPLIARTLNTLYCIPVQRPKDVGSKKINNEQAFARSYAHLQRGGNIYIAPEGGSELERKLRTLKTGTARIALGAEQAADWSLGLKIIPVGINYEHPLRCLRRVLVRVGAPIAVAEWRTAYTADPVQAVKDLTRELTRRMQGLLIQTEDKAEEHFLTRLERCWQHDEPLDVRAHHYRTQELLTRLRTLHQEDPAAYAEWEQKVARYRELLADRGLRDLPLSRHPRQRFHPGYLLGLPLFGYGWLNNWLAVYVPHFIERALGLYRGYRLTVFIGLGIVTVPLFYALQTALAAYWLPSLWTWAYLLSLPLSGWFASWYWRWSRPFWARLRYRWLGPRAPEAEALREEVVGPLGS
jgi:1-acyl-sn-glycerol-3-phosphate acyltransferase